jgi:hypothetical protein
MKIKDCEIIVASDVNKRDGIGIEVWFKNELIIEIFRDDTDLTKTITTYKNELPLDFVEDCIKAFKDKKLEDFIDYTKFE